MWRDVEEQVFVDVNVVMSPSAPFCCVLPLRQRKVRKSSVLGLRLDRSWIEEDKDDEESDERDEEGTVARPVFRLPGSATLTGVVLGELGCDWANFLWAWSRGLKGIKEEGKVRASG